MKSRAIKRSAKRTSKSALADIFHRRKMALRFLLQGSDLATLIDYWLKGKASIIVNDDNNAYGYFKNNGLTQISFSARDKETLEEMIAELKHEEVKNATR